MKMPMTMVHKMTKNWKKKAIMHKRIREEKEENILEAYLLFVCLFDKDGRRAFKHQSFVLHEGGGAGVNFALF